MDRRVRVCLLTVDFGRSLFALAGLIRGRGVEVHAASWRTGEEDVGGQPFVGSCAIFIVDPLSKVILKATSVSASSCNALRTSNSLPLSETAVGFRDTAEGRVDAWLAGDGAAQGPNTNAVRT